MTVEIRDYVASDRPQLIQLIRELQRFETDLFDRLKPPEDLGDTYLDNLLADCAKYDGVILVATRDDRLLGYAVLHTTATSQNEPDEVDYTYANVHELAVTQAERNAGLGTRLLTKCEEIARANNVKWLRVGVLSGNARALHTYEKFGFTTLYRRLEKTLD